MPPSNNYMINNHKNTSWVKTKAIILDTVVEKVVSPHILYSPFSAKQCNRCSSALALALVKKQHVRAMLITA